MAGKGKDWLDDYLHHFMPASEGGPDFGSSSKLADDQRALYDKMRKEKRHRYDNMALCHNPKPLQFDLWRTVNR